MSSKLTTEFYYIIITPTVKNDKIDTYHISGVTNNVNYISFSNYDINKKTIYYDEIVKYDPSGKSFEGIEGNYEMNNTKYNVWYLSKYISNRLVDLIDQLQLVNRCNKYGKPNADAIPNDCSNTFIGYDTSANIAIQKEKIFPLYTLNSLTSKKKHLKQQVNDVKNLIDSFNKIVLSIKNDTTIPSTDYQTLLQTNRENVKLRSELDLKLGEIYEYNSSKIVKSRVNLDTTVYTGVIWSILATSLAYFVFTKL